MKRPCELRFHLHQVFTHALLSCVPLCISWAFLVVVVFCSNANVLMWQRCRRSEWVSLATYLRQWLCAKRLLSSGLLTIQHHLWRNLLTT